MLVAGDCHSPTGLFANTLAVLHTKAFREAGFKRVGICGHPQGHKAIGPTLLWKALRDKQALAERFGFKLHIVTQFGFDPGALCAWERHLVRQEISLPVHVGISGPAALPVLIQFAMQCGVAASLRTLMPDLGGMSQSGRAVTSPDEMVVGLIRAQAAYGETRVVQPHFYSFGGAVATARWLRTVVDGCFELPPHGDKLHLQA
jgi:methylenetetrahydrofolate reductase (NADPH)